MQKHFAPAFQNLIDSLKIEKPENYIKILNYVAKTWDDIGNRTYLLESISSDSLLKIIVSGHEYDYGFLLQVYAELKFRCNHFPQILINRPDNGLRNLIGHIQYEKQNLLYDNEYEEITVKYNLNDIPALYIKKSISDQLDTDMDQNIPY